MIHEESIFFLFKPLAKTKKHACLDSSRAVVLFTCIRGSLRDVEDPLRSRHEDDRCRVALSI